MGGSGGGVEVIEIRKKCQLFCSSLIHWGWNIRDSSAYSDKNIFSIDLVCIILDMTKLWAEIQPTGRDRSDQYSLHHRCIVCRSGLASLIKLRLVEPYETSFHGYDFIYVTLGFILWCFSICLSLSHVYLPSFLFYIIV